MVVTPRLNDSEKQTAKIIAMVVRNALEDFHCAHLTDEQMKELNPIIRNGIATALHMLANMGIDDAARKAFDFTAMSVPRYWEDPVLMDDYVQLHKMRPKPKRKKPRRK
jgi:hypothetical protein